MTTTSFTQTGTTYIDPTGNQTLGGIYNLSNGTASLGNATNNGIINQSGGNLTASSYSSTDSTYTDLSNGTHHFGVYNLTGGTASLGNVSGNGTINVSNGTSLTASKVSMPNGTISLNGHITLSTTAATRQTADVVADIGSLTIGTSGLLDLKNHDLIIRSASNLTLSQVRSFINSAYDSGAWDGTAGITSSSINPSNEALGYAMAGELSLSTFDGISVSSGDILVKYTYQGDANLDGSVDLTDEAIMENNWGSATDWAHGYFEYTSGVSGLTDLSVILNNFGDQGGPAGVLIASTPEPASLGALGISAVVLLKRRKR